MMKAWLSNILWIDEDGEEIDDDSLPHSAYVEFEDTDDMDVFAEAVDGLLTKQFGHQPSGWNWELLTKEAIN